MSRNTKSNKVFWRFNPNQKMLTRQDFFFILHFLFCIFYFALFAEARDAA